jgi:hypothetical protein
MFEPQDGLLGWATETLVRLDKIEPGLIGRALTVSPRRRQAMFCALAKHVSANGSGQPEAGVCREREALLAKTLRHERAREILTYAFGRLDEGLMGALERCGGKPLQHPRYYMRLRSTFANPAQKHRAAALRYVHEITERRLEVLYALDDRWVHAKVLERIDSAVQALDFNASIEFAQLASSAATDEAIARAIAQLKPDEHLPSMIHRFVRRADHFPEQPPLHGDLFQLLDTADGIIAAGRKFRNCLASRFPDTLRGNAAYAVFRDESILEFRRLTTGGWVLMEVYGRQNLSPDEDVVKAAKNACAELGIPHLSEGNATDLFRRFRRFSRRWDWD